VVSSIDCLSSLNLGNETTLAWLTEKSAMVAKNADGWSVVSEDMIINHIANYSSNYRNPRIDREPCGVFVSDDGAIDDFKLLGPVCSDKNVPFVLAIVRNFVGSNQGVGYMNLSQLHEMCASGCELVGHTLTHPGLATLERDQTRSEVEGSVLWMREQGWECNHFVYPYGSYSLLSEHAAGGICHTASIVTGGVAKPPFFRTRVPRHAMGSFFYRGIKSFSGYKELVDDAVKERRMLIWMLHPWSEQHDANQQAIMLDLIDYMRDQGMKICNMTDAWKVHGNLWETPVGYGNEWMIDCDGNLWKADSCLGISTLANYVKDRIIYKKCYNHMRSLKHRISNIK